MSQEGKRKLSESKKGKIPWNKGKKLPEMSGEKHPMFGKHHSEETIIKLRASHKGQVAWNKGIKTGLTPWNKGIPLSDETKKKMSLSLRGKKKPHSLEHRKALSLAFMGRKGTNTGKKFSEEHKNKIRLSLIGHTHSEEARRKIGLAGLGRLNKNRGKNIVEIYGEEKAIQLTELNRKNILNRYESGAFPKQTDTKPERAVKEELIKRGYKEGIDFIHQYKFNDKFMCDFCFPQKKVITEIQGDFWHANPIKYGGKELHPHQIKGINRDKSKKAYITKCDNGSWTYMEIWESDIDKDVISCVNKIEEVLKSKV